MQQPILYFIWKPSFTHDATGSDMQGRYVLDPVRGVTLVPMPVWQLETSRSADSPLSSWYHVPSKLSQCCSDLEQHTVEQVSELPRKIEREQEREGPLQPAPRQIIC